MFSWIRDIFLKVIRVLKPIMLAVFDTAFQLFLARIKEIATASIAKLATSDLSDSEKRETAFKDIKAYAIQEALKCDSSDIYLAIEIFYKALKKSGAIK